MPIIKSAIKRMRQTATAKARNQRTKRSLRTALKAFVSKPSNEGIQKAQSELDKAVKKGVMKKNTASRKKAQLVRQAKAASVTPVAAAKTVKKAAPAKKVVAKAPAKAAPKAKAPVAKKPAVKKAAK